MFHFPLFLLLPVLTTCQWGTPPPVVTNEQCQQEYDKIMGCVRTPSLFSKIDEVPHQDPIFNQDVVSEITHILDCSGFLNCNSSRILQSYLFNQRWISDNYFENLEHCAPWKVIREIGKTCVPLDSSGNEDKNCNRISDNMECLVGELKKHPNCSSKDVKPFKRLILAQRVGCVMGYQWELEVEKYHVKVKNLL